MPELIECPECHRNNGVKRTACIYCGAPLPVTDETVDQQVPTLRPVEEWERGFSVVLAPLDDEAPTANQIVRLGEIARIDDEAARAIFATRTSLPVARVATAEEADLVARLLGAADLGATVLADDDLALGRQARRVRELRLGPTTLEARVLWGDWEAIARDEIVLAVEGRIVASTVEIVENAGKRRKTEVTDTRQFYLESYCVDIYGPTIEHSFRVKADSFDFACLGARPSLRLEENVAALGELLSTYVGRSRYDSAFSRTAKLLEHAWPAASQVRSHGLSRRGDFKKYTRSSVTTDALTQFTRYSRMRYVMSGATDVTTGAA